MLFTSDYKKEDQGRNAAATDQKNLKDLLGVL